MMQISNNTPFFADDNTSLQHDTVDPLVAVILCVLAICPGWVVVSAGFIFALEAMGNVFPIDDDSLPSKILCFGIVGTPVMFLMALLFCLSYSSILFRYDKTDHVGMARIVGVTFEEYYRPEFKSKREKKGFHYQAVLELDWGYEWACPEFSSEEGQPKHCKSTVVPVACSIEVEGQQDLGWDKAYNEALQESQECVMTRYSFDGNMSNHTPYDPLLGPSSDIDWPTILIMGDCESCQANVYEDELFRLERLRIASFLGLGASFLCAVLTFLLGCAWNRDRRARYNTEAASATNRRHMSLAAAARWQPPHSSKKEGTSVEGDANCDDEESARTIERAQNNDVASTS